LIEAWLREFSLKDNVQLIIKTDKPQAASAAIDKIRVNMGFQKKETAPILFEKEVFDEVRLPRFLKSVDCLISPTLGEGFGLPGLQCMALGIPIAITDFSGCQDYAKEETCTLIHPSGFTMHSCMDGLPQFKNKKWANVQTQEVCRALRHVISNVEEVRKKAEQAVSFVQSEFTYARTQKEFALMLREVYDIEV
jgi:glycosyltransferase involved in cell wall biosynthesis